LQTSFFSSGFNKMSLVQQILQAGADPEKVRGALESKTSPLVQDHQAMSQAMALVAGKKDALVKEMDLEATFEAEYPDDLPDSLASGWTIQMSKKA